MSACPFCGNPIPHGFHYCSGCGRELRRESAQEAEHGIWPGTCIGWV
ncbi:MAG: hypothetical protein ACYC55_00185 [Candidatus Geothermincolia bacterium]